MGKDSSKFVGKSEIGSYATARSDSSDYRAQRPPIKPQRAILLQLPIEPLDAGIETFKIPGLHCLPSVTKVTYQVFMPKISMVEHIEPSFHAPGEAQRRFQSKILTVFHIMNLNDYLSSRLSTMTPPRRLKRGSLEFRPQCHYDALEQSRRNL